MLGHLWARLSENAQKQRSILLWARPSVVLVCSIVDTPIELVMTYSIEHSGSPESDIITPPLGQTFKERDGERLFGISL